MTQRPPIQQPRMNFRLADRLLAERRITSESHEAALSYIRRYGGRIEEALLEVNALSEIDLLSYLAALHRTRFVSTDKLAKAEVDRLPLEKVPRKVAEKWRVIPVHYEPAAGALSIITADPHNVEMLDEVRIASGVKEVRPLLARPAAAKAAFSKLYLGDAHAFANIDQRAQQQFAMLRDVYERNTVTESSIAITLSAISEKERTMSASDFQTVRQPSSAKDLPVIAPPTAPSAPAPPEDYAETLNVLVSLIESSRADLRGHSAQVARLSRKLGERIGLEPQEIHAIVVAAYLHDLGKTGAYHLTALNVAQYEGHRFAAEKAWQLPGRLMESVRLSPSTVQALASMYERYDGAGVPGQRAGHEIPLGARILAIADSFADLTQNPRNPARRILQPAEACEVLATVRGSVFDPNLFDLFCTTVLDDDLRSRILYNRSLALLVDADPEETTVLELRMIEQGFEVKIARNAEQALRMLETGEFEIVVSELDLFPQDGFALLDEVRKQPWGRDLPWLILTKRQAGAEAQRAFALSVIDYVIKPAVAEVLVAKLKQALERRASHRVARGVSGSLAEMALPDLVQILWHGKKNGMLRLRRGTEVGELHFAEGRVVNAIWGAYRGEEAFYRLLSLDDGEFVLDPNFKPSETTISASPEALLLEGMRRLDEQHR